MNEGPGGPGEDFDVADADQVRVVHAAFGTDHDVELIDFAGFFPERFEIGLRLVEFVEHGESVAMLDVLVGGLVFGDELFEVFQTWVDRRTTVLVPVLAFPATPVPATDTTATTTTAATASVSVASAAAFFIAATAATGWRAAALLLLIRVAGLTLWTIAPRLLRGARLLRGVRLLRGLAAAFAAALAAAFAAAFAGLLRSTASATTTTAPPPAFTAAALFRAATAIAAWTLSLATFHDFTFSRVCWA